MSSPRNVRHPPPPPHFMTTLYVIDGHIEGENEMDDEGEM